MKKSTLWMPAILLCSILVITGCGNSGKDKFYVTGTVTFDGKPVPDGVIHFDPDGSGVQGVARIVDGHFDTRDSGKGVSPGSYTARIQGFSTPKDRPAMKVPLFREYIVPVNLSEEPEPLDLQVPKEAAKNLPPTLNVPI